VLLPEVVAATWIGRAMAHRLAGARPSGGYVGGAALATALPAMTVALTTSAAFAALQPVAGSPTGALGLDGGLVSHIVRDFVTLSPVALVVAAVTLAAGGYRIDRIRVPARVPGHPP
jgi:hypothetical protein